MISELKAIATSEKGRSIKLANPEKRFRLGLPVMRGMEKEMTKIPVFLCKSSLDPTGEAIAGLLPPNPYPF